MVLVPMMRCGWAAGIIGLPRAVLELWTDVI